MLSLNFIHLEHNFRYHGGVAFVPYDLFEFAIFGDLKASYVERVDTPVDREDVGFLDCDNYGLSLKFGYPFYLTEDSSRFLAAGLYTSISLTSNKTWDIHERVNQYIHRDSIRWPFLLQGYARSQVTRNPQLLFGFAGEYIPTPYVIFISELNSNWELGEDSHRYVWVTPGVRFCTSPKYGVNFDFGCEFGLTPEIPAWNFVLGLSVLIDVIP